MVGMTRMEVLCLLEVLATKAYSVYPNNARVVIDAL